jgi:hypothetical protein
MSISVIRKTEVHPVVKKTTFKPIAADALKVYKKNGVILDIPPLRYGVNNNFIEWNKGSMSQCGKNSVNLLSIWDTPPAVTEIELPVPDQNRMNVDVAYTIAFSEQLKLAVRDQNKLIDDKRKLFHWFILHLSNESEQKIQEDPNWNEIRREEDPLRLYILIRNNHLGVQSGNRLMDRDRVATQWQLMRQKGEETLSEYKDRFTTQIDALRGHDLPVPDDAMQSMKFIQGLDETRHRELKILYSQHMQANTGTYPPNLTEAYNRAANFKPHFQQKGKGKKPPGVAYLSVQEPEETKEVNFVKKDKKKNNKKRKIEEEVEETKEEIQSTTSKPYCQICEKHGHWTNKCFNFEDALNAYKASRASQDTTPPPKAYNTRGESRRKKAFVTYKVNLAPYEDVMLSKYKLVLDTAATVTLVNDLSLLSDAYESEDILKIKAVNGQTLETSICGTFGPFGKAFYAKDAEVNLIPLGPLEKKFKVIYTQNESFQIVIPNHSEIMFKRTNVDEEGNCFYIFDASSIIENYKLVNVSTVEENTMSYSKREVEDAKRARDFIRKMGYPSTKQAIDLIQSGSIYNCPVTAHDIIRAERIFGPDIASLKGKTVHMKDPPVKNEYVSKPVSEIQSLNADLLYVDNKPYLITVSTPLNLTLVSDLNGSKSEETLSDFIIRHVNEYKSEGFSVDLVYCDREGGIIASKEILKENGIVLNLSSSGQHVPIIERNIRTVKERIRAILSSLPFRVPYIFMPYLVDFAVMRINSMPKSTMLSKISPRELFTGRKIDYKKDLRFGFGDYVQVEITNVINKNSVRIPRTEGAIAMAPTGNLQGSVIFYLLSTKRFVTRDTFKILPMPNEIIDYLNNLSGANSRANDDVLISYKDYDEIDESETVDFNEFEPPSHISTGIDTEGPNILSDENDSSEIFDIPLRNNEENIIPTSEETHRYPIHQHKPVERYDPSAYYHLSIQRSMKKRANETIQSVMKELKQMIEKHVFDPVLKNSLTKRQLKRIIRSFCFMKEKYLSNGLFDKLKARLVANGKWEMETMMDISSPTISLSALMMVAAIAAKENRHVATCDVPGAYLNADMLNEVFMILEPLLSNLLCKLDPKYKEFLNDDNTIIVKLKKALYGCVESARLWYDTISNVLTSNGFIVNPQDNCVFNKSENDKQCTICIYVDDLFITCEDESMLDKTIDYLKRQFKGLTANKEKKHSYLGMTFNYEIKGEVKITAEYYTDEIISMHNVKGEASSPAMNSLFEIRDVALIDYEKKKEFHSVVAKLLYLAKRTRPDILTAVSFLTTRVNKPNIDDWNKVQRVLKYINGTKDLGIILRPNKKEMNINAYFDASYGVHEDGKSHSGLFIALGEGPIFVRSTKQRIVSKSSTEAELISLSDGCSQIIWSREFLIHQGYDLSTATVYEDNKSTMALILKGKSTSNRTRHINVRYFFVKDRIDNGEIDVKYMPTNDMIADILTKPLQGKKFIELRNKLLNWHY